MKYKFKASLIIPTRKRARLLEQRLEVLFKNTNEWRYHDAELIIALDEDDEDTKAMVSRHPAIQVSINAPLEIPCIKWNKACVYAKGEWLVTISDDCIPEPNWLTNALSMLSHGFLGLPDGITGTRNQFFTPLYMATREWLRKYNGGVLVPPYYKSWYGDCEVAMKAHRSHTYIVAGNSVVTQLHSIFNTAPDDEIYKLGESRRADDLKVYRERELAGFPDDPAISIL